MIVFLLGGCGGGGAGSVATDTAATYSLEAGTRRVTLPVGTYTFRVNRAGQALRAATSLHGRIFEATPVTSQHVRVVLKSPGRGSLKLTFAAPGSTPNRVASATGDLSNAVGTTTENIGIRVTDSAGNLPGVPGVGGTPGHLTLGSIFRGSAAYESTFGDHPVDTGYVYLQHGFDNGWFNQWPGSGGMVRNVVNTAQTFGMIQTFVYYQIPGDQIDSADLAYSNINSASYMQSYFTDLVRALQAMNAASTADGEPVVVLFEPDFLGYMMTKASFSANPAPGAYASANTVAAAGMAGVFGNPAFKNASGGTLTAADVPNLAAADASTLRGFVLTVNYLAQANCPNAVFGWELAHWGSNTAGRTLPYPGGTGLMHITDGATTGPAVQAARATLANEAALIVNFAKSAGITQNGARIVALDKYGFDGGGHNNGYQDPSTSTWFWNIVQWHNLVAFASKTHELTTLPVVLWQMPVGHVNGSTMTSGVHWTSPMNPAIDVAAGAAFPDLLNQAATGGNDYGSWEDSSTSFFFGDTFNTTAARAAWFGVDDPDPAYSGRVTTSGNQVTWQSAFNDLKNAGVISVHFGPGVGGATSNTPFSSPPDPTDSFFWFEKARRYLQTPLSL